jgi:hypothetical protein
MSVTGNIVAPQIQIKLNRDFEGIHAGETISVERQIGLRLVGSGAATLVEQVRRTVMKGSRTGRYT